MDKATQTMIENLQKNTGKSLEQWIEIVKKENVAKHGEFLKFLKETHGLTHGYANLVSHMARSSNSGQENNPENVMAGQFKGKEHFKPLYEMLISEISAFGKDVEIAPKKSYVSLRRKKQFATLNPATKTRFEIGINLKGQEPNGKLQAEKSNAMCSHKINLTNMGDVDKEVIAWLKAAYEQAG